MNPVTKFFLGLGCLLLLLAIVMRLAWIPIVITGKPVQAVSVLILANTSFILAILFRK